jgi:hypothetical protein
MLGEIKPIRNEADYQAERLWGSRLAGAAVRADIAKTEPDQIERRNIAINRAHRIVRPDVIL